MWITKVVFKGSDQNSTTIIDESTDKGFAKSKYSREITRWLKILCNLELPTILHGSICDRDALSLDIIQAFVNSMNKENKSKVSFTIEMYEQI